MSLFKRLVIHWQKLQDRERKLALWCGVVILCAVVLSLEDWQRGERIRLQKSLPAAEARLASMQKMADELNGLSRLTAQDRPGMKPRTSAESLVASAKSKGSSWDAYATGSSQLVLKGEIPFDDWIEWLAGAATQGWRVEKASVLRDLAPPRGAVSGIVRIEATLVSMPE